MTGCAARLPAAEENRRRWFDPTFKLMAVKVLPGEHYVSRDPHEMVVTVLGSCVAACVWDPVVRIGGMNHFMLPESNEQEGRPVTRSRRYGNYAMEALLNDVLRRGGQRDRLEIKVFGGANVLASMGDSGGTLAIGERNADFVRRYLDEEQLAIAAEDLGGRHPRRIHFFPQTGKVVRLFLRKGIEQAVLSREISYRRQLQETPVEGEVELFG